MGESLQERLKTQGLSTDELNLLVAARRLFLSDSFHTEKNGGFSSDVNAQFVGFVISSGQVSPVYKLNDGQRFAIDHYPDEGRVSAGAVKESEVYPWELIWDVVSQAMISLSAELTKEGLFDGEIPIKEKRGFLRKWRNLRKKKKMTVCKF